LAIPAIRHREVYQGPMDHAAHLMAFTNSMLPRRLIPVPVIAPSTFYSTAILPLQPEDAPSVTDCPLLVYFHPAEPLRRHCKLCEGISGMLQRAQKRLVTEAINPRFPSLRLLLVDCQAGLPALDKSWSRRRLDSENMVRSYCQGAATEYFHKDPPQDAHFSAQPALRLYDKRNAFPGRSLLTANLIQTIKAGESGQLQLEQVHLDLLLNAALTMAAAIDASDANPVEQEQEAQQIKIEAVEDKRLEL